jgi:hypothetical protein
MVERLIYPAHSEAQRACHRDQHQERLFCRSWPPGAGLNCVGKVLAALHPVITVEGLRLHCAPTLGECIGPEAEAGHGSCSHVPPAKRLATSAATE